MLPTFLIHLHGTHTHAHKQARACTHTHTHTHTHTLPVTDSGWCYIQLAMNISKLFTKYTTGTGTTMCILKYVTLLVNMTKRFSSPRSTAPLWDIYCSHLWKMNSSNVIKGKKGREKHWEHSSKYNPVSACYRHPPAPEKKHQTNCNLLSTNEAFERRQADVINTLVGLHRIPPIPPLRAPYTED